LKRQCHRVVSVLLLSWFLSGCSKWAYKVPTDAMEPTIKKGDSIWVDQQYYSSHPIERFDIVMFMASEHGDPHQGKDAKIVKRVIGLGGEQIQIVSGKVLVNGAALKQSFSFSPSQDDFGPVTVPQGEYFLLGDNRDNSYDSRFWTPPTIGAKSIKGKVTGILHK